METAKSRREGLRVYVGGCLGASAIPTVVAYSVETAMRYLLDVYSLDRPRGDAGYPERWTCLFIDAEGPLRWTTILPTDKPDLYGEQPANEMERTLYVEPFDVEDDKWDPDTGHQLGTYDCYRSVLARPRTPPVIEWDPDVNG